VQDTVGLGSRIRALISIGSWYQNHQPRKQPIGTLLQKRCIFRSPPPKFEPASASQGWKMASKKPRFLGF